MSRGRPYKQWARAADVLFERGTGFPTIPHTGHVYPLLNTFRLNQIDDTIDHILLDVTVVGLIRPVSGDTVANDWPGAMFFEICAAVEAQGSGVIPDPTDQAGPDQQTVVTGSLTLTAAGIGWAADFGFLTEQWARWQGSISSEGIRKSPDPTVGPAAQASMYVLDESTQGGGPPFAPVSNWYIRTYLRALHTSRVPF